MKSIIDRLGTNEFARIRLGVGPDHPVENLSAFVLAPIPKRERDRLERMLDRASDAAEVIITSGAERAMALFNERVKDVTSET